MRYSRQFCRPAHARNLQELTVRDLIEFERVLWPLTGHAATNQNATALLNLIYREVERRCIELDQVERAFMESEHARGRMDVPSLRTMERMRRPERS